jgi:dTDP-4-dehydrorhamnose 3,5-epimerase
MEINKTHINDCYWTKPDQFIDHRGVFSEIYKTTELNFESKQSNYSFSKKGTIRGIHCTPYAKYITCVSGEIYDVCVDLRKNSTTHKQYFGIILNGLNLYSLYIPPFCGHAFLSMADSIVIYQQTDIYQDKKDYTFCYCDYNIQWPFEPYIISDKDKDVCHTK